MLDYSLYFLVTLLFSSIFAVIGIGSSLVLIPLFTILGIDFTTSKILGLLANGTTTSYLTVKNIIAKNIDFKTVFYLILMTSFFASVGAYISRYIDEFLVEIFFIGFIVFSQFITFIIFKYKRNTYLFSKNQSYILISFIAVIAGLLGIGGGALYLPFLIYIGYGTKKSIAVVSSLILFVSFSAFFTYLSYISIEWKLVLIIFLGALLGGYIGQNMMKKITKEYYLRMIIFFLLFILLVVMLYQKLEFFYA